MLYPKVPFAITFNADFKGTPLLDVEYLITIQDWRLTQAYYRPVTESDMWPTELFRRQWISTCSLKGGAMAPAPPKYVLG